MRRERGERREPPAAPGLAAGRIYLDASSTSHPKPDCVWHAARDYLHEIGASPGRAASALGRDGDEVVAATRRRVAELVNAPDDRLISFTLNATHALNMVIVGALRPGDHVVTTALEHNSVLRPLERLRLAGRIDYSVAPLTEQGVVDVDQLAGLVRDETRMIVVNHASNVIGTIAPLDAVGAVARAAEALFVVDASQSAGWEPLDVEASSIDALVFTGHKGLLGPSGTGGAFIRTPDDVEPLCVGGTGMASRSLLQPAVAPVRFEAGTLNYLGIAGLGASLEHIAQPEQVEAARAARKLGDHCANALRAIDAVDVAGRGDRHEALPVLSFTIDGLYPPEVASALENQYGIIVRPGLHCAPLAHNALGTAPHGTVRVSLGRTTTDAEIATLVEAVDELAHTTR